MPDEQHDLAELARRLEDALPKALETPEYSEETIHRILEALTKVVENTRNSAHLAQRQRAAMQGMRGTRNYSDLWAPVLRRCPPSSSQWPGIPTKQQEAHDVR